MTREEAKDYIREWCPYGKQDQIINALEQQPCEDCVSREAVMKCFKKWQPYMATRLLDYEQELKELPSVTPTSDAEDKYDIGYNCGYADAMSDIAGSEG
jgi:hypothetical protein